jgi:CheY-like chemotaxis protein
MKELLSMHQPITILIAEDDDGHAGLIMRNLERSGLTNKFIRFEDGDKLMKFLFSKGKTPHMIEGKSYLLLLDIRMPKIDGIEVLAKIKADPELKKIPVIMLTTTDNPKEVSHCYELGCNNYIKKPVDYDQFIVAITQLGMFLNIVELPHFEKKSV